MCIRASPEPSLRALARLPSALARAAANHRRLARFLRRDRSALIGRVTPPPHAEEERSIRVDHRSSISRGRRLETGPRLDGSHKKGRAYHFEHPESRLVARLLIEPIAKSVGL